MKPWLPKKPVLEPSWPQNGCALRASDHFIPLRWWWAQTNLLAAVVVFGCLTAPLLHAAGTITAWGSNSSGQTEVPAGLNEVVSVAAGGNHSLALRADGTVVAWGDNGKGQANVPPGLSDVVAISAGGEHSLALLVDGTVIAWGDNGRGQTNVPPGLGGMVAIAAGGAHNLALSAAGRVMAWGYNSHGQTNVPAGLNNVVAIAAGREHSVALLADGTVVAWGFNSYGQTTVPAGLNNVVAITAGGEHSLALLADGTMLAWGLDGMGQTTVPGDLSAVVAVAAGGFYSLALQEDGTVAAWGWNHSGQTTVPAGLSHVIALAAAGNTGPTPLGGAHNLAVSGPPEPVIFQQPISRTNEVDTTAWFRVAATGIQPCSYQWRFNGADLMNGGHVFGTATSAIFLTDVEARDAGEYSVVVSNAHGSITSRVAILTVSGSNPAWEGADDFSSGISAANWTFYPNNSGDVKAVGTNGHASFIVPKSLAEDTSVALVWHGNPTATEDWTVEVTGHASAAESRLQLYALPTDGALTTNREAYYVEMYQRADRGFIVTQHGPTGGTRRVIVNATNTFFSLRLAYRSTAGRIEAWCDPDASGLRWTMLDAISLADFSPTMSASDTFTFAINAIAPDERGPITEGQLWADDFRITRTLPDSPSIVRQPAGLVGATMATVQFTVEAAGAEPLAYQWRKNGMNLANGGPVSGVTTTNLTIANLQAADAGDYSVVVSNASGTATSLSALLLVLPPPTDDLFPIALDNQWTYDNGSTARVSGVQEVGGRKLVAITNVGTTGYVNVTVDAVGVWNTSYSGPDYIVVYWGWAPTYWLKYPMSLGQQWSDSLLGNGYRINHLSTVTSTNATVTINGTPCGPCTEVTATVDYPNGYSPGEIWWTTMRFYYLPGVGCIKRIRTADDGTTDLVQVVSWSVASGPPPEISRQPDSLTLAQGATATFSVTATGAVPLAYQWRFNGTNLLNGENVSGATSNSLTITGVRMEDSGDYSVAITNAYGRVTSSVAILDVGLPPAIVQQPENRVTVPGRAADFRVSVSGSAPLSYQWLHDGTPLGQDGRITGTSGAMLRIEGVQSSDVGGYSVTVENGYGTVTSVGVSLKLGSPFGASATHYAGLRFTSSVYPGYCISDGRGGLIWSFVNGLPLDGAGGYRLGGVVRTTEAGVLDPSFVVGPGLRECIGLAVQRDGKILIGCVRVGDRDANGARNSRVVRVLTNGVIDTTYTSPAFDAIPRFMGLQSDGKLLVTHGSTTSLGNNGIAQTVRLNTDGSLDAGFQPVTTTGNYGSFVPPIADTAGRIYIAGGFTGVNGISRPGVARLLPDGRLDGEFNPGGFTFSTFIRGLVLQADGKVVIGGRLRRTGDATDYALLRLNTDGTLDPAFNLVSCQQLNWYRLRALRATPEGRMIAVAHSAARFQVDGALDETFARVPFEPEDRADDVFVECFWLQLLVDNRVIVPADPGAAGPRWFGLNRLDGAFRLKATGEFDPMFQAPRFEADTYHLKAVPAPDGQLLVAGGFKKVGPIERLGIARFDADGLLDLGFSMSLPGQRWVGSMAPLADGRVYAVVGLGRGSQEMPASNVLVRVTCDGELDGTFAAGSSLIRSGGARTDLVIQGTMPVISGADPQSVINRSPAYTRFQENGAVDASFASGQTAPGFVHRELSGWIRSVVVGDIQLLAVLPGQQLLVAQTKGPYFEGLTTYPYELVRLKADGSTDPAFVSPALPLSGSYVSYDWLADPAMADYGQYPITYPVRLIGGATATADGRVLICGGFREIGGVPRPGLARLLATGDVDPGFPAGAGPANQGASPPPTRIDSVSVDTEGRIWVTGQFELFDGYPVNGVARLNPDGTLDESVTTKCALVRLNDEERTGVALGADGSVLLTGSYLNGDALWPDALIKLVSGIPGAPPIRFLSDGGVVIVPGGSMQLKVSAAAGQQLVLQASTNLVDWSDVKSEVATETVVTFLLPLEAGPTRFYRARTGP